MRRINKLELFFSSLQAGLFFETRELCIKNGVMSTPILTILSFHTLIINSLYYFNLVTTPGLKPGIFAVKGRRVNQFHHVAVVRALDKIYFCEPPRRPLSQYFIAVPTLALPTFKRG